MAFVMSFLLAQMLPYVPATTVPVVQADPARARVLSPIDYAIIGTISLPICAFAGSVIRKRRRYHLGPQERDAVRLRLDPLVWVNTKSGIYYFEGDRWYQKTREGVMLPLRAARTRGNRPAKNARAA